MLTKDIEEILSEFEHRLGLPQAKPNNAEKYLDMTQADIIKMSLDEAGEARFILAQFAFYIQRAKNRQLARVHWSDANIDIIIERELENYSAPSKEERRMKAIAGNDVARKLNHVKMLSQVAVDDLEFLADKVKFMAETLVDIIQNKRRKLSG